MNEYTSRPPSRGGKGDASGYDGPTGPGRVLGTEDGRVDFIPGGGGSSGIDNTTLGMIAIGAALVLNRKKSKKR
jgi:hypothetical protein